MNYPQTLAKELLSVANNLEAISKYGCLAMCYLYCVGIQDNALEYIKIVSDCMDKGFLDNECTVLDAEKYLEYITGRKFKVSKRQFNNLKDIKNPSPVKYTFNGVSHWVVVENGKIVFNSLLNSNCVNKGKPATKENTRIITLS